LIKRGRFHYGYKGHNLVNYDGYFLGGHVTGANVSDIDQLEEMMYFRKNIKLSIYKKKILFCKDL